jgi:hypothetical protein
LAGRIGEESRSRLRSARSRVSPLALAIGTVSPDLAAASGAASSHLASPRWCGPSSDCCPPAPFRPICRARRKPNDTGARHRPILPELLR